MLMTVAMVMQARRLNIGIVTSKLFQLAVDQRTSRDQTCCESKEILAR
jgi:hypothetical protein